MQVKKFMVSEETARCRFVVVALLSAMALCMARADSPGWLRARGVWPAGTSREMNGFVGFRADFPAAKGEEPVLRIAGSSVYRIYVNGMFAGYGPARGPKGVFRQDEWPLSSYVREGTNSVAVEVAGYNVNSFYVQDWPSFLQAEVVVGGEARAYTGVGGDFAAVRLPKVAKCSRFTFQRAFAEAYRVRSDSWAWRTGTLGETCPLETCPEVALLPRRCAKPMFEVVPALIAGATESSYDPSAKLRMERFAALVDDDSPYWRGMKGYRASDVEVNVYAEVQRVNVAGTRPVRAESLAVGDGIGALVDVGRVESGFLGFAFRCTRPGRLIVTFDEILSDGRVNPLRCGATNGFVYDFLEPGDYRLENFEPNALRYAHFSMKNGCGELSGVYFRTYKNADACRATFSSSDPALDKVFLAARETFAQNAVDVFTDCPGRERAGWLCDSFFTARASHLLTGSPCMETLFVENYALAPESDVIDGMLPMCYPADHPNGNYIPNWAMWFVLELDEYVHRGGDRRLVEMLRPRLERLVGRLWQHRNSDGLLEKLDGWVFVEWSQANKFVQDVNYPSNMAWAEVLDCMDRLYGRPDLADEACRVREAVRSQSWNGTWFRDHALRQPDGLLRVADDVSETCQYYAFFFRVATPETHPALWNTLVRDFGPKRLDPNDRTKPLTHRNVWPSNAFIGNYLRLECLSRFGHGGQVLDEARGMFQYMAERTGTLWEHVGPTASCDHGFASHAAVVVLRDVLGIEKVDHVEKTIQLRRTDVSLERCQASIPTTEGLLSVGWRRRAGELEWDVSLPSGWKLTKGSIHSTTTNGVEVRWFEEMVPMKDGVRLYTYGALPPAGETRGIVFRRNPYVKEETVDMPSYALTQQDALRRGYAYVEQHVRGTGMSEGAWVPYENEREDGLAMLEWLRRLPHYGGTRRF